MSDSGTTDEAKGRLKEAAGSLLDDAELKREGRTDRVAGKLKRHADRLIDKAKDAIGRDKGDKNQVAEKG